MNHNNAIEIYRGARVRKNVSPEKNLFRNVSPENSFIYIEKVSLVKISSEFIM